MSQLNSHNGEELSQGNRYYWRIPKGLPVGSEILTMQFILHGLTWEYVAFYTSEMIFRITVNSICEDDDESVQFSKVRGGIIGIDKKELVGLKGLCYKKEGKLSCIIGDLIAKSELYDIIRTNKVLYVFVEMERKNDEKVQSVQQTKAHKRKIETDFKDMLLSGKSSDVTIQVKRKKFKCHKCVLGARSSVFSAMMEHDMKEKVSGVVTIKDAEPATFQEFLLFLYTGNKEHLNWKNVIDLYSLADKYDIEDLKSLCVSHIKENITVVNFFEFFLLSQQYNDTELKDATIKYFLRYSKEIVGSNNWMIFLSKNLVECNVLITALVNK